MQYSIKKAAVIGAGAMGAGIAALIAGAGIPVVLLDIVLPELTKEEAKKGIKLDAPAHRNFLAQAGKNRVADKKTGVLYLPEMAEYITVGNLETDLHLLKDCDWIVEVVAENLGIKQTLFQNIVPYIKADAILSTNTSGLPVGSIAPCLPDDLKKRFLGTHFFNPPRYMRLFEIIPSNDTDPAVIRFMKAFGNEILGKGIVEAKDTPNFIGNRIGIVSSPVIFRLMDKYGFDVETVDYLTGTLIGRPKSATFKTADLVGLDILIHVLDNLADALNNPEEKDLFTIPDFVRDMQKNNQLGNKTGGGFYKRTKNNVGKAVTLVWDKKAGEYVPLKNVSIPFIEEVKKQRRLKDRLTTLLDSDEPAGRFLWELLETVLVYSARKVTEIADSYEEIDKAMRWGFNWEVGPFEIWNLIGFEKTAGKMKADGYTLPEWVEKRLEAKKPFYDTDPDICSFDAIYAPLRRMEHSVMLDMGDGVVGLEVRTPGNAITEKFRREITEVLDEVEHNNEYVGLVLLNSNQNFLTGADLKGMLSFLENKDYEAVQSTLVDFQRVSLRLKYAKKPVVAAIHGMVLGGGMEYAIHASRIVAHVDTFMGLVETGVGIIPGGGGIKELLMRSIAGISTYSIADHNPVVSKYWEYIATAAVSKNAYHAQQMGYLLPTDKIVMQIDLLPQRAKEEVQLMVKEGYRQKLPTMTKVTGTSGRANLEQTIKAMRDGNFISEYDAVIVREVAKAITGGDVPKGTVLSEEQLLELEREGFATLCHNEKTYERVKGMLETGRALRN